MDRPQALRKATLTAFFGLGAAEAAAEELPLQVLFPESAVAISPDGSSYGTTEGFGENRPKGGSIHEITP